MSTLLKQSTAVDIAMGPFLDETDGKTAETALTITQPDIRLKKNGGAWAQKNAAQTLTHEENGWYEVALDATDTNTLGELVVAIHEAGALPVWRVFQVVPAAVYDALVSGSGNGVRSDVQAIAAGAITAAAIATGAVDADALAADAVAEIADGVWDEDIVAAHGTSDTAGRCIRTLDAVSDRTNNPTVNGLLGVPDSAGADVPGQTTDEVWDELKSAHTTPDSFGDYLDDEITSRAAPGDQMNLAAGAITAAKFGSGAIDAAAIATGAIDADALAADAVNKINQAASGTADAGGSTTTIVDAERTEADTDYWKGSVVLITSGSAAGQVRRITAFNAGTDTLTVSPAFTQSIGAGVTYIILRNTLAEVLVHQIEANAIDATAIATDAIDGDAIAASAVTEIQSGLATSAQVDDVEGDLNDIQTRLPAALVGGRMAANAEVVGDKTGYALTSGERDSIAAALLDLANGVETGYTLRQTLRLMSAVIAGKASGGPGGSVFRNLPDTANRVAATADSDGNRTVMTHTP